jgi:hypothetical protein
MNPWPQPEKNQAAMISRLDGYVGQLLEQLQKIHQDSNNGDFFHERNHRPKSRWR